MRWLAVAVALSGTLAWAEPPVSNPPPTPSEMEFPPPPPEHPRPTRGVSKIAFFTLAGSTIAVTIAAIALTAVANSQAQQASMSIFSTTADQLSQQAQLESEFATGGWFAAVLLGVATVLVATITRWGE
jgi:cytochrome b561